MKNRHQAIRVILLLVLIVSCTTSEPPPDTVFPAAGTDPRVSSTTADSPGSTTQTTPSPGGALPPTPGWTARPDGLTAAEASTLQSLEQADTYPLYIMRYQGAYRDATSAVEPTQETRLLANAAWGCSLFAALGARDNLQFGRNFDWEFSPALLLFTDPPDGYASASMVDIAFLGFRENDSRHLLDLPLGELEPLLDTPHWPFDGMNEHGLAIGMAAVPPGHMKPDPNKETLGSLGIIREMLDHARNVDEALASFGTYNIDFGGGPPIHYLVADRTGRSILIEYFQGRMVVLPNEVSWQHATNFLRAAVGEFADGTCWRYDRIHERLAQSQGQLSADEAMNLLTGVAQTNTQWSIVYSMSSGGIHVAVGQKYDNTHLFDLE